MISLKTKDAQFLGRDAAADNITVVKTDNNYIIDANGQKYIDLMMGWCVGNIGWGRKEIVEQLKNFDGPTYVNPSFLYEPWVTLAELLAGITPGKLQHSFRATGGTEAVEIALQAAMSHTKRHHFISIAGSYHGHSIAAMSIGDSLFRQWYSNLLPHCHQLTPPLNKNTLLQLETLLKQHKIAAFIMEPIICNLGVEIPTQEFMQGAQQLCHQYGALFIMDEVATGFGRTGKLFASDHFSIAPDILCLGKGISGGYGAIGATITTDAVAKSMHYDFSFYSTFGWHPMATAAAIANIHYLLAHQHAIEKNTQAMSAYFVERLSHMSFSYKPIIRAKGLAIALEFEKTGYAAEIASKARHNGVILSSLNNTMLTFFPALTIDFDIAKEALDLIEKCL